MEKVLEKFGAAKSGIALYGIDIEENAAVAAALGARNARRRFSSSRAVRSSFQGRPHEPREMAAFFEKA